jgi:hypothetical protein
MTSPSLSCADAAPPRIHVRFDEHDLIAEITC